MNNPIWINGDRIKSLRIEKGMTQQELSTRCEIGRTMITNIESGIADPSIGTLILLSQALNTTTDYLLNLSMAKSREINIENALPFDEAHP